MKFVVFVELDCGRVVLELPRRHGRPLVEFLGARDAVELLPVAVHVVPVEGVELERVADLQVLAVDDKLRKRREYDRKLKVVFCCNSFRFKF